MPLDDYRRKRRFDRTPEPAGDAPPPAEAAPRFVVQKHSARRLHYDFRLELDGVLKSWAVPKGPCLDPSEKRLAVQVEDHPLEYADFEGAIPQGDYGGGTVIVWDRGTWSSEGDAAASLRAGEMKFHLHGEKLHGRWALVRMRKRPGEKSENWLLIKERDDAARPLGTYDVLDERPESALSGRTLDEVAANPQRTWISSAAAPVDESLAKARRPRPAGSPQRLETHPESVPHAVRGPFPKSILPQLAQASGTIPSSDRWLHEIKFDGYRLLSFLNDGRVVLRTRSGLDWTSRFPEVADAVAALPVKQAVLDGEVVVLLPNGASNFSELQAALSSGETGRLVYFVFDLLYLDGYDLRKAPLLARKRQLAEVVAASERKRIQYADHLTGSGAEFFRECGRMGLEGIISKRADAAHHSGRGDDWLKRKCLQRDEFVIGGFTVSTAVRRGVSALLIGAYNAAGGLVYTGKVGTGFTEETLHDLRERLMARQQEHSPFANLPDREAERGTRWVRPELVAQVEYGSRSRDGILRYPVFQGLREDKPPREVMLDAIGAGSAEPGESEASDADPQPATTHAELTPEQLAELGRVRFTHPERLLYPRDGITKLGLATFYAEISDWILPHVAQRPISLVRCPDGEGKKSFFQQHAAAGTPDTVHRIEVAEGDETETHLMVDSLAGLLSLVQMSVLEVHPWGARVDDLDRPDRIIFDLDPDPSVPWPQVVAAALELRQRLLDLGLASFVKTTGSKGLHIVAPIQRRQGWDEVKRFARALAERMAADAPSRYTAVSAKASRRGRIFLDYLRNGKGSTAVAAYSTRARAGAPVSTPLTWEELPGIVRSDEFHVGNLPGRLAGLRRDPWEEMATLRQSLTAKARKALRL